MTTKPIFEHKTYAMTEYEVTRGIEVRRKPDGDVAIRVTCETEWDDQVSLPMVLSPELATRMAHAMLGVDDAFDGVIDHAVKYGNDTMVEEARDPPSTIRVVQTKHGEEIHSVLGA